ncbi:ABC transporter ATP-binding protein [Actinopolymorpha pittospori]
MSHLRAEGLSCAIAGRILLSDVDLDLAPGRMMALVGVNGSGKSTLLRTLVGLQAPAAGRVFVHGQDLHALRTRERARRVAYVPQEEQPPGELLVGEMVALGRVPYRPPWALRDSVKERDTVVRALDAVGLVHVLDRPCDQLSGGERRRVLLARGLAQECDLLVLDEPTNHLDVRHQVQLLRTLRATGRTVLAAMHDLSMAAAHFDEVAVLHKGTLHVVGPPRQALEPDVVTSVFEIDATRLADPATGREHLVLGPGMPALTAASVSGKAPEPRTHQAREDHR